MVNNETDFRKSIGNKIRLARFRSNYTQEKLAEKTSLSARYISQLERGLAFGSASTIISICNALDINSDFLFSDLVKSTTSSFDFSVDNKFLDSYLKLNAANRKTINIITSQLLKAQEENAK